MQGVCLCVFQQLKSPSRSLFPCKSNWGAVSKLIAAFYLMAYNKCSPELCLFKYYSVSLFFLPPLLQFKSARGKTSSVITINYCSMFPKQSKFMLWISYSVMVNPTQLTLKECEGVFVYVSLAIKTCQKAHSVKETTVMHKEETDRESLEKGWVKCVRGCVCMCVWVCV